MVYLIEMHEIGYGYRTLSQIEVVLPFQGNFLDMPPISQQNINNVK